MEENNMSSLIMRAETSSKNKDLDDDFKLTALFTAGTAVLAVGLKRATVVFLLKQWQLWIFLVLNLLLLAILFCSTRNRHRHRSSTKKVAVIEKQEEKEENFSNYNDYYSYSKLKESESTTSDFCDDREASIEVEPVAVDDVSELSDEELNERVESFIASFKKQLVLDARK